MDFGEFGNKHPVFEITYIRASSVAICISMLSFRKGLYIKRPRI